MAMGKVDVMVGSFWFLLNLFRAGGNDSGHDGPMGGIGHRSAGLSCSTHDGSLS